MLTFWIIVLSLGLLSMLVPPFLEFIVGIVLWPLAIIISPFVILTNRIKAKQGIKGNTAEEERELRENRTKVFCGIFAAIAIPLCIISIIIMSVMMRHNSELLLYSDLKIVCLFIGIPALISGIVAWLILLIFRKDV